MAQANNKTSLQLAAAKYKAFISYSHRDDKWAAWLHRALESYKPPKHLVGEVTGAGPIPARLAPVFRDREELPSATDLGAKLTEALEGSACQIVLCSPTAARSQWVNEEILAFKRLGRSHRIFCLIVDGEPNASDMPGREDEECFPPAARFELDENGELSTRRSEPIAADARPNKDGKHNAKLKLLAGILDVGFDNLAQREAHRRQQRILAIAGASFAGMVVTTALAVTAIVARSEAVEQRQRAEIEAETAQQTTAFMVELFEVSDPSEALGNSITAREILDRGARRIEFELSDQPAIQSTLMDTMGTVYRSLGLYSEARQLLQQGLDTRQRVFGTNHPSVAASQANIAEVLGLQAEFDEAVALYQTSIETLKGAVPLDRRALAAAQYGLAEIYALQGDFETAERQLVDVIDLQRSLAENESLELAASIEALGMALFFQARYEEAETRLQDSLSMLQRLLPGGVHPDLSDGYNNLGYFYYTTGEFEQSQGFFRRGLEMNQQLLGDQHPEVASSLNNLAFVQQDSGNLAAAEESFQQALDIRLNVLGEGHPMVAQTINNLAFVYYDQGLFKEAIDHSRQAVAAYREAYAGDHPDLAYGLQNLASWLVESGEYGQAQALYEEAMAINERVLPADHPDIAITRSGLAVFFLETGDSQQALDAAESAMAVLEQSYGLDHWRTQWASSIAGAALSRMGMGDQAETRLLSSYEGLKENPGARPVHQQAALQRLVAHYERSGNRERANQFRALSAP